jgi:hypothetical protein
VQIWFDYEYLFDGQNYIYSNILPISYFMSDHELLFLGWKLCIVYRCSKKICRCDKRDRFVLHAQLDPRC